MRIGFFTDSYFPEIDGVTYTIQLWRERLEAAGHEVSVVYPDGDYEPDERELPVTSLPNPFYGGYNVPLFRRPSTLPDLDLVHCHGPAPVGLLGRYYARKHDIPAIYTHHTPLEEYFHQSVGSDRLARALGRAYVPLENAFLRSFDAVTASTSRIERDVEHVELPVGIDMDFFAPTERRWFSERPVIGYSGRLSMEKNVREILRIARQLPEYDVRIVGAGPFRDSLEERAPENVEIRGFLPREELPTFYSSIDVFVTASTADTLGLSTLEANACGTPVAAVDAPPFDRTIGPDNGVRFEYGDLDSMAGAIEACLDGDRETRAAVERYSIHHTIGLLETLYRDVTDDDEDRPAGPPSSGRSRRELAGEANREG
ncbi:glycosyltransferase [Halalkalicoccus jeotgali]|uniref:Glycosyl transferase group 1 n=1 Tax=Halalkalicoccus jeotgali (strain DSM 18796 / CECT 7217 / JCM 14584 / KCTC 4019 / B3) TaxID=795797 RepID=D8J885_HALJB|nr:glycosyltransferase [Halalkalicoccus jeotgali]ADJ14198.1 glycosyl transferase group 1 [Halalkalicoccus jeotgali B3]ELY34620.1 group 1 glycosyl transferase [Halalkalicoccus jeotgali B3]